MCYGIFPWILEESLTDNQIAQLHAIDESVGLNPFDKPAARLSQLIYACAGQKSSVDQWYPLNAYQAAAEFRRKENEAPEDRIASVVNAMIFAAQTTR